MFNLETVQNEFSDKPARCRHFGLCGGCRTQGTPYPIQIRDKQAALRNLLRPVLPEDLLEGLKVFPSPALWRYRNRMEFTFSSHEGEVALGLHRRGRYWELVDLEECWLCPETFMPIVREARRFATESRLPAYDKKNHTGFWRYLIMRGTQAGGKVLAEIMTADEDGKAINALADYLRSACPQLSGLFWSLVPGVADAPIATKTERCFGERFLIEKLAGLEVPVEPRTFLQPNVAAAEILYTDLANTLNLKGSEMALDLYCGVGTIGAMLARKAGEVYGIEKEAGNVEMGQELIRRNHLANLRIAMADVGSLRNEFDESRQADVIIVDPPRAGLNKAVLKYLHSCSPRRIAYISCNPKALKDNLRRFHRAGVYRPWKIAAYDMFPHTLHIETLCVLDRVD